MVMETATEQVAVELSNLDFLSHLVKGLDEVAPGAGVDVELSDWRQ